VEAAAGGLSGTLAKRLARLRSRQRIEPLFPVNTNPMMANDFGFYYMKTFELPRRFESSGVPFSPLESSPVLEK
jgi:hypothetical protein